MPLADTLTQDTLIDKPTGVSHGVSSQGNPPILDPPHAKPAGVTHNVFPMDNSMTLYDSEA